MECWAHSKMSKAPLLPSPPLGKLWTEMTGEGHTKREGQMHPTPSWAQISRPSRGALAFSVRKALDSSDAAASFERSPAVLPSLWHGPVARCTQAPLERGDWRSLVNCRLRQLHFIVTQHGQYYE